MKNEDKSIPLGNLLQELQDPHVPFKASLARRLSTPSEEDFQAFSDNFNLIPPERRQQLLSYLSELMEFDFELDYGRVATFALADSEPEVRVEAINALWFENTQAALTRLLRLLEGDEDARVRAAAATSLGRFILMKELEEFPARPVQVVEEALSAIWTSYIEDQELRRRALESLSYSSRDEIPSFIEEAYSDNTYGMRPSAILAMGRNGDEGRWRKFILKGLSDQDNEIRFEAAHAAGEMMLSGAVPQLTLLAREYDAEIAGEAIWSLGEIGGSEASAALSYLRDNLADEDLLDLIDEAQATSLLMQGAFEAALLEFSEEDEDDFIEIDLDNEWDEDD